MIGFSKDLKKRIKTVDAVAIACLGISLILNLWLFRVNEIIALGSEIGIMADKLCLSFVSGYIFYSINVKLKQAKDRKVIYPFIRVRTENVKGVCQMLVRELSNSAGVPLNDTYPTKAELHAICIALRLNGESPLAMTTVQPFQFHAWQGYFVYCIERSDKFTASITEKASYLDAELISLLTSIQGCAFFNSFRLTAMLPPSNQNLTAFENLILRYCEQVKQLDSYIQTKLAKY